MKANRRMLELWSALGIQRLRKVNSLTATINMPIGTTPLADGHYIPNLAFGTGSALYGQNAQDAVKAALDAGFRHIDTAQAYQNEKSVGDALGDWLGARSSMDKNARQAKRDKLWVTTKYSGGDKGPLKELEDSLERVGPLEIYV